MSQRFQIHDVAPTFHLRTNLEIVSLKRVEEDLMQLEVLSLSTSIPSLPSHVPKI